MNSEVQSASEKTYDIIMSFSRCPHHVRFKIGIVHAAVSLESRGMLQLQPGERKVIKAAGEVDI